MARETTFRGKRLEELEKLDTREFAKYLKSEERRNALRQFDSLEKFIARAKKYERSNKQIRTHLRSLIVVPKMVGMTINVHNGKEFLPVKITIEMLGHRLGEFALTRGKVTHGAPGIGATRSSAAMSVK
jgi:small subunit ribosomal protein S19